MPNPSIVNATAVGKEVIRRSYIDGAGETEATILTGVANHIMTIVSIIIRPRYIVQRYLAVSFILGVNLSAAGPATSALNN